MEKELSSATQFGKVCEILDRYDRDPAKLIPILQAVQEEYRYLPEEILTLVATSLNLPPAKVYGVATFYAQFALAPKGKYVISVCMGTACYVKGAQAVLDKLSEYLEIPVGETTEDGEFTLDATRCIGACGLAPVMTVNDDVYGRITPDQVAGILDKYRA